MTSFMNQQILSYKGVRFGEIGGHGLELDYHWNNCRVAKGAHFEHLQINLKYFLICKLFCVKLSLALAQCIHNTPYHRFWPWVGHCSDSECCS